MAISKLFHFQTDAEGFTATTTDPHVIATWRKPYRGRLNKTYARRTAMGGCLRMTALGAQPSSNYWELTTTWEALGVPAGQTVTAFKADYQCRFSLGENFFSINGYSPNGNASGPLELRNGSGGLIGTTSPAQYADPAGFGGSAYAESHYPSGPKVTGTISDDVNHNWLNVWGSSVAVSGANGASSAPIRIRLGVTLQFVDRQMQSYLRIRQDRIVLAITTGSGPKRRIYVV